MMETIRGTDRDDILRGDADAERLLGLRGDDDLLGRGGADRLVGGPGTDTINGGAGRDVLVGGAAPLGSDTTGAGGDKLFGGAGFDTFVFGEADRIRELGLDGYDLIFDLAEGEETIDLSRIDADATRPGDQAFTLVEGEFAEGPGELALSTEDAGTFVVMNVDRDEFSEFQIFVFGSEAPPAGDFIF